MEKYEIKTPVTDKDGLQNQMKMIFNQIEDGNSYEAKMQLHAIIDDLSPDRVHFEWMSTRARAASKKQTAENLARYCVENPGSVD